MTARRKRLPKLSSKAALQLVWKRFRRGGDLQGKVEFPSVEDCADWYMLVDEIGRILREEDTQCAD